MNALHLDHQPRQKIVGISRLLAGNGSRGLLYTAEMRQMSLPSFMIIDVEAI